MKYYLSCSLVYLVIGGPRALRRPSAALRSVNPPYSEQPTVFSLSHLIIILFNLAFISIHFSIIITMI